jgi:hypothetical protein
MDKANVKRMGKMSSSNSAAKFVALSRAIHLGSMSMHRSIAASFGHSYRYMLRPVLEEAEGEEFEWNADELDSDVSRQCVLAALFLEGFKL